MYCRGERKRSQRVFRTESADLTRRVVCRGGQSYCSRGFATEMDQVSLTTLPTHTVQYSTVYTHLKRSCNFSIILLLSLDQGGAPAQSGQGSTEQDNERYNEM